MTLNLRPRQDLLSVLMSLFTASPETLVIEVRGEGSKRSSENLCLMRVQVPLSDKLEPFVMALFPARKEKRLRDEMVDLSLAKPRDSPVGDLVFLSDASEIVQKVKTSVWFGGGNNVIIQRKKVLFCGVAFVDFVSLKRRGFCCFF